MKLLRKEIEKDGPGSAIMIAEQPEDMWHLYNLMGHGDCVRSKTFRKVVKETATGSTDSQKVTTTLTIEVESVYFDPGTCLIRIKGRNVEENKHVKMGAYHTIDLEMNRKFTLSKSEWDSVHLERLAIACDIARQADVAAVVMAEGLAHVCLISGHMTAIRAKIEQSIPRKRRGSSDQHDKAVVRFYDAVMQALLRHVNFEVVKCVVVASPGFVKDEFFKYMYDQATKLDIKLLFENRSKFVLVHSTSGHKHALKEALTAPGVATRLAETKAMAEVHALEKFFKTLHDDPHRACYGVRHVTLACERGAIDQLLVTDALFRASDLDTRRRYVALVEAAREAGGEVHLFSSMHVSGEQLGQLSGVAATLRFPLPELDELEDEASSVGSDSDAASESGAESDTERVEGEPRRRGDPMAAAHAAGQEVGSDAGDSEEEEARRETAEAVAAAAADMNL